MTCDSGETETQHRELHTQPSDIDLQPLDRLTKTQLVRLLVTNYLPVVSTKWPSPDG